MKTKNIKVAYASRYPQSGYHEVPKIRMEGRWLEELGITIGSTVMVEYGDGSIHIRPMTAEETAARKRQEMETEIARRKAELAAMQKSLGSETAALPMVAEPKVEYTSSPKASRRGN